MCILWERQNSQYREIPRYEEDVQKIQGNHNRTGVYGNKRKFISLNDHFDRSLLRKKKDGGHGDAQPEGGGQTVSRAFRVCLDHPSKTGPSKGKPHPMADGDGVQGPNYFSPSLDHCDGS